MPDQIEHNVDCIIKLSFKGFNLGKNQINSLMRWFLENQENSNEVKKGQTTIEKLFQTEASVEVLDAEISKEELLVYKKEFKKYGVHFAVSKTEEDKYIVAFAGRNSSAITYAMENILKNKELQQNRTSYIEILKEKIKSKDIFNRGSKDKNEHTKNHSRMER